MRADVLPGYFTATTRRGRVRHVVAQHYRDGTEIVLCGVKPAGRLPAGGDPTKPLCKRCIDVLGFDFGDGAA